MTCVQDVAVHAVEVRNTEGDRHYGKVAERGRQGHSRTNVTRPPPPGMGVCLPARL